MTLLDLGTIASHYETEVAHAMLEAIAWAHDHGADWWEDG